MKFDYDDINLVPKKCTVNSRSECDTSIKFGSHTFKLPVVPANMECVVDSEICIKLAKSGYFYIMHRFDIDIIGFIRKMNSLNIFSSISIGVNDDSYKLINMMTDLELYPDYITIDIAHGHSIKMESMIRYIKLKLPNTFIIAGNVSTQEAIIDLQNWGADSIKVGIGPGCFIPSAEVKTSEGLKSLQDILIGDYVITHNNKYKKVLDKHSYYGEQELLKINNLPPCTDSHEFYVIEKSKIDLVNENNLTEFAFWIKVKDLDKNKHLLIKYE